MRSGSSRAVSRAGRSRAHRGSGSGSAQDVDLLARWLDSRFVIPGTNIRFGLDALIGLIPGVGDTATALLSSYIIYRAVSLGAPASLVGRMVWNVLVDMVVGAIPLAGDIFDVAYRANLKNAALLKSHLDLRR